MTKRSKRVLFYAAVAIFILLSYIVILYAQGYKYSLSENKFLRTGAISLKVNINSKVFLNDKLEGGTSFFSDSFSIDRLLPDTYSITVERDGYSSWHKLITVEEGFVTDFPRVMILPETGDEEQKLFDEVGLLFDKLEPIPTITPLPIKPKTTKISPSPTPKTEPELKEPFVLDNKNGLLYKNTNGQLEEIAENVKGFRISENKNKLAWWTNNELWVLWLNDQNYQPLYKKGDKELITRFQFPILNGTWFRDEDHVVLELEKSDSRGRKYSIYRVVEIDKRGGVNIIEL